MVMTLSVSLPYTFWITFLVVKLFMYAIGIIFLFIIVHVRNF